MAIHTSSITYRRGIPNNYNNFYLVVQANNVIISPMSKYLKNYSFYNRNITNKTYSWPWKI
jgi:hypothetical protein